ncbi:MULTISPECIES: serine hydrolase domain-containing protein [Actinomadura]|uniref:Serine hydrolase domain-containing protein n=1 Tax=Actinomadura yumaensis TaxID=111807 RepID=A0ABW2CEQ5_9ACTN|nr:serine hydrolase domain-containing protein [Actinomadura sp. J1-007]MWK35697.1 serine hydrolase [Actinomadura sp. J1-007]
MKRATTAVGITGAMLALSTAVSAAAAVPVAAGESRSAMGDVQRAMDALAGTPGVVGAIGETYVDGKRVGRGTAGSRLLNGKGGRIPTDARYRIASQTKRITATVLLQLVDEHRLGLDDKLSEVLPEVARRDLVERADEITVRQLVQLTSGIPDFSHTKEFDDFDFTTHYRPTDLLKASRSLPREQEPGEKFSYSNTDYILLGMIIEKVSRRSLAAEFKRRIFRPLGMDRTYLPTRPGQGIKGPHGHGYFPDASGRLHDMDRLNPSRALGAGGVVSNARDISRFFRAFQRGDLLPADLQRVLEPQGPPPNGGPCGGRPELRGPAGSAPGLNAVTFTTPDGRRQFAVSVTLSMDNANPGISAALSKAAGTVFCPKK